MCPCSQCYLCFTNVSLLTLVGATGGQGSGPPRHPPRDGDPRELPDGMDAGGGGRSLHPHLLRRRPRGEQPPTGESLRHSARQSPGQLYRGGGTAGHVVV
jgi:hypothetical protein